ncbi:hypothetical protein JW756_01030 [Candidatus Woesearchaeota archaeon]|nr:hypothetical protein [Candidatus Woesearchaeota archaeon]
MRKTIKLEVLFGLFALALIYLIINNNASITGFVISPAATIILVSPADNTQTDASTLYFQFQYPPELDAQQCALILNGAVAKTATGLLDPYDTRIRMELAPGTYDWRVECADSSALKIESVNRRLIIGSASDSELKITKFPSRAGYAYEFEIKEGMELKISNLVPNDVIIAKKGINSYEIEILRVLQDYSTDTEIVEFRVSPGERRMRMIEGDSASIDFNLDGLDDIMLMLEEVSYEQANFIVRTKSGGAPATGEPGITEPTITITPIPESDAVQKKAEEQMPSIIPTEPAGKQLGFTELFLIGLAVVLIIAIISTLRNRSDIEKNYIKALQKKAETPIVKKSAPVKKASVKKKKNR